MIVILKQIFPLVLSALILVASLQATDAAARGVRGRQQEQLDSLAVSGDSDIDSVQRELKKKKTKKKKKMTQKDDDMKSRFENVAGNSNPLESRFDFPAAPTPAPAPSGLAAWEIGCAVQDQNVGACAASGAKNCKRCLYALSFTSATPDTAASGINACAKDFCGSCESDDISPFFTCGYYVKNPNLKPADTMPDPSIRTPPPISNAAGALFQAPVIDGTVIDTVNCPAVYPGNNTNCVMIDGFNFKNCTYYEVGPDHRCECSVNREIWNCTGTIRNPDFLNMTNFPESANEVEPEEVIKPLPSSPIVASRIEVVASEAGGL